MIRDERELLAELSRVNSDVVGFVLEFISGDLSTAAEKAFAYRLEAVAHQILRHAGTRDRVVLDVDGMHPPDDGPNLVDRLRLGSGARL